MKFTSSSDELKLFCDELIQFSNYVAIDTEFVRINTYYPNRPIFKQFSENFTNYLNV